MNPTVACYYFSEDTTLFNVSDCENLFIDFIQINRENEDALFSHIFKVGVIIRLEKLLN